MPGFRSIVAATLRDPGSARWNALRRRLSGSVLGLLLFGFLLVCTPLVVGLLSSGQQIGRVTQQSEVLLQEAIERNQAARRIRERLVGLERAARQYRLLLDQEAFANVQRQRNSFSDLLDRFENLPLSDAMIQALNDLRIRERALGALVLGGPADRREQELADVFAALNTGSTTLLELSDTAATESLDRLTRLGERARATVLLQLVLIIPFAVIMALVFTGLINRPIRRLDQGIRALAGRGNAAIPRIRSPRDLRALSVRLEWARRKLARVDQERQRLIGQVSHELKTPLSAIREGVSLITDEVFGQLSAEQREVMSILDSNGKRLEKQIDSLLQFNRISTGSVRARRQTIDCAGIIQAVLDDHAFALRARNLDTAMSLPDNLTAIGDPDMLGTVLDNLVSNAIKFAPDGSAIGVYGRRTGDRVCVDLADQGPGVAPSERARLFEPFYRGSAGATAGSGLGLAIARDLVQAMGGTIAWTERAGWSTVFSVCIPADRNPEIAGASASIEQDPDPG